MRKPRIVVDTREQKPWSFPGTFTVRRKIKYGDYALSGYSGRAVERKSISDLVHCATTDIERLGREADGARGRGVELLMIVEGTWVQFKRELTKWSPSRSPHRTLARLIIKTGLPPVFCSSREEAAATAVAYLLFNWGQ